MNIKKKILKYFNSKSKLQEYSINDKNCPGYAMKIENQQLISVFISVFAKCKIMTSNYTEIKDALDTARVFFCGRHNNDRALVETSTRLSRNDNKYVHWYANSHRMLFINRVGNELTFELRYKSRYYFNPQDREQLYIKGYDFKTREYKNGIKFYEIQKVLDKELGNIRGLMDIFKNSNKHLIYAKK